LPLVQQTFDTIGAGAKDTGKGDHMSYEWVQVTAEGQEKRWYLFLKPRFNVFVLGDFRFYITSYIGN
jgi:hypothetical protein